MQRRNTHEELEHTVLCGINFRDAYLTLRQRIREEDAKLLSNPQWYTLPSFIRQAWAEISILSATAFTTIAEDGSHLLTQQEYYQRNRKPNLRRRGHIRRLRIQARIAQETASETQDAISLPSSLPSLPPEQDVLQAVPTDPKLLDPELLRQIEAAKAATLLLDVPDPTNQLEKTNDKL